MGRGDYPGPPDFYYCYLYIYEFSMSRPQEYLTKARRYSWSKKAHRSVISVESVVAMRRKGLTQEQIADALGCHLNTVRNKLKLIDGKIERVDNFRAVEADLIAMKQSEILEGVSEEKIEKANLRDSALAYGILFDKRQLLEGKPTQFVAYADILRAREGKLAELKALEESAIAAGITGNE